MQKAEKKCRFYVGTYTKPILFGTGEILEGKGDGIYLVKLDMESGKLECCGLAAETDNPSYLCMDGKGERLYAVNELKEYEGKKSGAVTAYAVEQETGGLVILNQKPTKGQDPCHLALSEEEGTLVISNFMSGSVCAYRVGTEGLAEEAGFFSHSGTGPNAVRQKGPHAHSAVMIKNSRYFFVPDLGTDRLAAYEMMPDGRIAPSQECTYMCVPGSGPRYGEYRADGNRLYIINELASSVSLFYVNHEDGKIFLECRQTVSTIQDIRREDGSISDDSDNICADLHLTPDGRFLYASNRGRDTIAIFLVDAETGMLHPAGQVSCGGRTPRNFSIEPSGKYLLVGNQDSDQIVVFGIDKKDGSLTERSRLDIPTPVCVLPIDR